MIVGDGAYPMRPYTGASLAPKLKAFNFHQSSVRVVVENAFGRLKARWRILKRQLDIHVQEVPFVIGACCILHNLCEETGCPAPCTSEADSANPGSAVRPDAAIDSDIRETLADYIFHNN